MLYNLELPDLTRDRLTDMVWLQMGLLAYAAQAATIDRKSCTAYLQTHRTRFQGNAGAIADWLCASQREGNTWQTRDVLLQHFADACHAVQSAQEQQAIATWLKRLRQEVQALLTLDDIPLTVQSFFDEQPHVGKKKQSPPHWQERAANFLLYFYSSPLQSGKFPKELFPGPAAEDFGREELLRAFLDTNKKLEICPMCDESRYYTQSEHIHAILDHYFPKDRYPHFCCHPYNLVPVCYACNSAIKGTTDPFLDEDKHRRSLSKRALPYRGYSLTDNTYLEVEVKELDGKRELAQIKNLLARPDSSGQVNGQWDQPILLLKELYQLPNRWAVQEQTNRIFDTLYRRMRHFFGKGEGMQYGLEQAAMQHGTNRSDEAYNTLKQLLYYLDHDDQQKDPFAFPMTWLLAALLKAQKEDARFEKALVAEINSWFGQSLTNSEERDRHAETLLQTLEKLQVLPLSPVEREQ